MKSKVLFLLLLTGLATGCRLRTSKDKDDDDDQDTTTTAKVSGTIIPAAGNGVYVVDYKPGAIAEKLNLEGAACVFNLSDTTAKMFKAVEVNDPRKFVLSQENTDSVGVINFKMANYHSHKNDVDDASINLSLNAGLQWDINAKTAASKTDFDLAKFKIRNLHIELAAGEFDAKLAPVLDNTNVDVHITVGTVKLSIPKDAACELHIESTLADSEFPGFTKTGDGHYVTSNFATAKNKIHITAKYSLAKFRVEQY